MFLKPLSAEQTETIYLHLEDNYNMPTPFPTLTEMEKFAQKNNLQSLTSEFGDVENQDAIDAAQGYNKSEQERVSKNFYDAGLLNKYRELNSKKLDERNAVINMQRSLRGSAGVGSTVTDTGFAQTTMGSDYMPEFVPREAPKFQNLPKPEFQKATISRFNPNSGDEKDKWGEPRFVDFNGGTTGSNARTFSQVLQKAATETYNDYAGYSQIKQGLQNVNQYLVQQRPDLMAEQFDVKTPHTNVPLRQANILTVPTVMLKYAQDIANKKLGRNGESFISARTDQAFDNKEERLLYNIMQLNGGNPQIDASGNITYGGYRYIDITDDRTNNVNELALGGRLSNKMTEIADPLTSQPQTISSLVEFKVVKKPNAIVGSTEEDDYIIVQTLRPEADTARKILALSYEVYYMQNPNDPKFRKYLADHNDLGRRLNWDLDKMREYAANAYAAEVINEAIPNTSPQVFQMLKQRAIKSDGFKLNQTYGLGDTEDYIEAGLLSDPNIPAGLTSPNNLRSLNLSGSSSKMTRQKALRGTKYQG